MITKKIQFRTLGASEPEASYETLAVLFRKMYDYMEEKGLQQTLTENGEQEWIKHARRMPGKMNHLVVAEAEEIIGFAHGTIRLGPKYLGEIKTGFVSHVFVLPEFRRQGVAAALANKLTENLKASGAQLLQLEVLTENKSAVKFWEKLGFHKELYRMYKTVE